MSTWSCPGYEADDILATLARQAEAEGRPAVIVTGDRDALQLAGPCVRIMANTRGVTEVKVYDPQAVEERFGVPPRLIPDLIGLKGDTSDNIPGVPGIGEKTAAQLLIQFGSLEEVLAHTDEVAGAKRKELLREHRETALLSKRLALLDRDAPIDFHTAEVQPHQIQRDVLEELLTRFEFTSLLERLEPLLATSPPSEAGPSGPSGAALPSPTSAPEDAAAWESLLDWDRAVGLAADRQTAGLWLAQPGSEAAPDAYESYRVVEVQDPAPHASALRDLFGLGAAVCHDLKSAPVLRGLIDKAGHDTYVAAYLLAPGRREYRLEDCAREAAIRLPSCELGVGEAAAAATGAAAGAALAPSRPSGGRQASAPSWPPHRARPPRR